MEFHILTLQVTEEQESAIKLLFIENKWTYIHSKNEPQRNSSQQHLSTSFTDTSTGSKEQTGLLTSFPNHDKNNSNKSTETESYNNSTSTKFVVDSSLNLYNQHITGNFGQVHTLDFSTSERNYQGKQIDDVHCPQSTSSQRRITSMSDESSLTVNKNYQKYVSGVRDKLEYPNMEENIMNIRDLCIKIGKKVLDTFGKLNYVCPQKSDYMRDEWEFIDEILSNLFSVYREYTSAKRSSMTTAVRSLNTYGNETMVKTKEERMEQYDDINLFGDLNTNLKNAKGTHVRKSGEEKLDELPVGKITPVSKISNNKAEKTSKSPKNKIAKIRKTKNNSVKVRKVSKRKTTVSREKRKSKQVPYEMSPENMVYDDNENQSIASYYEEHYIINSDKQDSNVVDKISKVNEKTEYLCDLCGAKFAEKKVLNGHRKYVHTENRPEQCVICDKRFKTKSQLANHKLVHKTEQELDLSCEVCGKLFRRAGTLKDHVRRHKKDYSEFCAICGKGFYRNYWLQEHMKSHSGLKPHDCKICGFKTALKCNLNKHMKTHRNFVI